MMLALSFVIEAPKLVSYLLNPHHKDGGSKAKLLLAHGFTSANAVDLARALVIHATDYWPGQIKATNYGQKHIIDGSMKMPDGTSHDMRTVWQVDHGSPDVRFITAY